MSEVGFTQFQSYQDFMDFQGARGVDLLSRNINNIVGNLWQRQETEHTTTNTSNSSNGNMSPGSHESCPESPHGKSDERRMGDDDGGRTSSNGGADHSGILDESGRPSIGIRSDLLPQLSKDGGFGDITGLPALEALRRQAGYQNPFLSGMGSPLTPSGGGGLQLTSKRPSQPPTPQSSTSGGDPSSAWSFEEQFKQLYEIDENPKRKEFLDDLFSFMQKRGTPINRLPIMAKQVLDLYELYNLVVGRGGLVEVINKKQWQEIIKGLGLPSSITSAAFTLRTQYTKYLYPYESHTKGLSSTDDLQNAIDGNRREGRRMDPYPNPMTSQMSPMGPLGHHLPASLHSPPRGHGGPMSPGAGAEQLQALEMTKLALWKLYNQGQPGAMPGLPPLMPNLPNLDLFGANQKEALNLHMAERAEKEQAEKHKGEREKS